MVELNQFETVVLNDLKELNVKIFHNYRQMIWTSILSKRKPYRVLDEIELFVNCFLDRLAVGAIRGHRFQNRTAPALVVAEGSRWRRSLFGLNRNGLITRSKSEFRVFIENFSIQITNSLLFLAVLPCRFDDGTAPSLECWWTPHRTYRRTSFDPNPFW